MSIKQNIVEDISNFEAEIERLYPRYLSAPHTQEKAELKDLEGKSHKFFQYFPNEFEDWREASEFAERKSIIYRILDKAFGHKPEYWQLLERYNDDAQPQTAINASQNASEEDKQNVDYWNAIARSHFLLGEYEKTLETTRCARDIEKNRVRTWRIYADALFETGNRAKAQELYERIFQKQIGERIDEGDDESLAAQTILGFEGDIINSPIHARAWFMQQEHAPIELWQWAEEEFSYSPHFLSFAAIKRLEMGEYAEALGKLINISRRMPYYREAVVNAHSLISQLELEQELAEEKSRLEQIIAKKNW